MAQALRDRFRFERELGRGGMATVYLAHDLKHDRLVALKVLRPDLAAFLGPARFLKEIRFAARLQHPHILPVFDSGEAEGQLWYTMPYVEGESLRERLRREVQLPVAEAVHIAREVAEALDYSHRHGVIHRDIKPENILLEEHHAVVADFGIARGGPGFAGAPLTGVPATETGMVLGTPAYMSPEQGLGESTIDGRSDIYALGCVLYEMLVGVPPLMGPTVQAMLARRVHEKAPRISTLRETAGPELDAVVARALAYLPADRFHTAADFAASLSPDNLSLPGTLSAGRLSHSVPAPSPSPPAIAPPKRLSLNFLLAFALLVGLAVILTRPLWRRTSPPQGTPASWGIAVLPFENIGDTADRAFADGMSEEITTRLARVPGLQLVARSSARQYRRASQTAAGFGRTLGVDYVLDGTVRVATGQAGQKEVRITSELIRVSDDSRIWGEPYGGVITNVFQLQAEVAAQVAEALQGPLQVGAQRALARAPTEDLEAYRLYALGRAEWDRRTPESLERAAAYFRGALARDSGFARAWAGLADAYALWDLYGVRRLPRDTVYGWAREAALRAIALDSTLAEPHASLNQILRYGYWDWAGSEREIRRALDLDPDYATAHQWLAEHLLSMGRFPEAIAEARTAVRLDPLAPATNNTLGFTLRCAGQFDEAIRIFRAAMARDSMAALLWINLLETYLLAGREEEALALGVSRGKAPWFWRLRARAHRDPVARAELIDSLQTPGGLRGVDGDHEAAARHLASLGAADLAFTELERAVAERQPNLEFLKVSPEYAALRGDSRFVSLLARVGLPP